MISDELAQKLCCFDFYASDLLMISIIIINDCLGLICTDSDRQVASLLQLQAVLKITSLRHSNSSNMLLALFWP